MFFSLFFFFSSRRRHTRYIGDWSSDVCSSDLIRHGEQLLCSADDLARVHGARNHDTVDRGRNSHFGDDEIGRASCRERVGSSEEEEYVKREQKREWKRDNWYTQTEATPTECST